MARLGAALVGIALVLGASTGAAGASHRHSTPCSSRRAIVLGSMRPGGPFEGWGACRPREFSNGGDPSGTVGHIRWTSWGGRVATGHGLNSIFSPRGGYYRRQVVIYLRAFDVGRCSARGRRAYLRLRVREPSKPHGPLSPWRDWSPGRTLCGSY